MHLIHGDWTLDVLGGALRTICWRGVEVVRGIDCPVRDTSWGTYPQEGVEESWDNGRGVYRRTFGVADGALRGTFLLQLGDSGHLSAELRLSVLRDFSTNRAGLVVLHPIAGVAGTPLQVLHSDRRVEHTHFPARISPGQPALDICGLTHEREGITLALEFAGEVFEMEDQRNWGDASFKTYCRPLALPTPYTLKTDEEVWQRVVVKATARRPEALLAVEAGWLRDGESLAGRAVLLRLNAADTGAEPWLGALEGAALDLEVIVPEGADPEAHLAGVAGRLAARGLAPRQVLALPEAYLRSYQPEGPWPDGPTPADAAHAARRAFPSARIGVGMLTNFTELNRCRPEPGVGDYLTFSTTAIVHAADDRSVCETLEALPQLLESAKALAPGLPIRLGLVSIGMRTNPYGAGVAPNPERLRKPMAQDDPRQATAFAADYARAAYEIASRAGVEALALAAPAGPFAATGALREFLEEVA